MHARSYSFPTTQLSSLIGQPAIFTEEGRELQVMVKS